MRRRGIRGLYMPPDIKSRGGCDDGDGDVMLARGGDDRLTVSVAGVIGIGGGSLTLNASERLVAVLGLLFCVGWAPKRGGGRVDNFVDGFHSAGAGAGGARVDLSLAVQQVLRGNIKTIARVDVGVSCQKVSPSLICWTCWTVGLPSTLDIGHGRT
jgi:hypothetical protein